MSKEMQIKNQTFADLFAVRNMLKEKQSEWNESVRESFFCGEPAGYEANQKLGDLISRIEIELDSRLEQIKNMK